MWQVATWWLCWSLKLSRAEDGGVWWALFVSTLWSPNLSSYTRCQSKCYNGLGFWLSQFWFSFTIRYSLLRSCAPEAKLPYCSAIVLLKYSHPCTGPTVIPLHFCYGVTTFITSKTMHCRSTNHDHKRCLERHLQLWKEGDLLQFLQEGRTIQRRLQFSRAGLIHHKKLLLSLPCSCSRERLRQLFGCFSPIQGGFSSPRCCCG